MKKRVPFAVFLFPSFGRFSTMRSNGLFAPYRRAGVGAKQYAKKEPIFGKKKFHGIRRFHGTLVRMAIQNFSKNPVISTVSGLVG